MFAESTALRVIRAAIAAQFHCFLNRLDETQA